VDLVPDTIVESLGTAGVGRGSLLAVAASPGVGFAVAGDGAAFARVADDDAMAFCLTAIERDLAPRWVVWNGAESRALLDLGVRLGACWNLAAVHRLTVGGWKADPPRIWAHHRGLDPSTVPDTGRDDHTVDLFTAADRATGDLDDPVRPDGHLRSDWGGRLWDATPTRLAAWAAVALEIAQAQTIERAGVADRPKAALIARSESTVELLCNEMAANGLPMDSVVAESIVGSLAGPRPAGEAEADEIRRSRDAVVLAHAPVGADFDLRSPGQVKSLLRRVGIEVPDTRAWRLEPLVGRHPIVKPLLEWRKAERMSTTFGYAWLDEHLGDDGRLRGSWTSCDGAAGRMTASAGMHNMPAEMRPAVIADDGYVFVRADLGQVEPRVLAAVSGDPKLAKASTVDDLYAEVAETLGVEREIAKVAVLGAMYGQTTGRGAQALAELRKAYPVSMDFLDEADRRARGGHDLMTYGGRRLRMDNRTDFDLPEQAARSRTAARGRYGRNAVIQGAAAELFKMWAVTVRSRAEDLGADVVLCLHDELLVQAPMPVGQEVATLVDAALDETVRRWAPDGSVRFLADTALIGRWSDAKD